MDSQVLTVVCLLLISALCYGDKFEAKCNIDKTTGDPAVPIEGELTLVYDDNVGETTIKGTITGFNKDDNITEHGFHIHTTGKMTDACKDAGGHFNPQNKSHGGPDAAERHIGDLGNVVENEEGVVTVDITDQAAKLDGVDHVVGRAIVVHAKNDDFVSQPTGAAGGRLGCCLITLETSGGSRANFSFGSLIVLMAAYFLFLR